MKHFFKIIVTILYFCTFGFSGQPAEAGMISEKQEIEMGRATARQIEARYGVLNDPQITDRVNRNRLKPVTESSMILRSLTG